jgi:multiple sugar transport system permease protein
MGFFKELSMQKRRPLEILSRKQTALLFFLLPAILVLVIITLFPFIYAVVISFTGYEIARPQRGSHFVGLDNYIYTLTGIRFWNSMKVTFIMVFSASIVELLLGFALAYLLRDYFLGRKIVVSLFIIPMVIPPIVAGLTWRFMYDEAIGVINYLISLLGLAPQPWLGSPSLALPAIIVTDIWQWTPFIMLIVLAGLHALPEEPFEAARVDGASNWQIVRFITLPMLRNVILVGFLIRVIELFRTFDTIYIMTEGGPGTATETMSIQSYLLGFRFFATSRASAFALIMLAIVIFICGRFIKALETEET